MSSPTGSWTYSELLADGPACARNWPRVVTRRSLSPSSANTMALRLWPSWAYCSRSTSWLSLISRTEYPRDVIVDEAGPSTIVHDPAYAKEAKRLAERIGARTVDLSQIDPGDATRLGDLDQPTSWPVMLAFTSGTSGTPKAAEITNGVIMNLIRGATNALGIDASDRMPMLFPTSLAVASYPMFLPLLNGGTLATLDVRSVGLEPVADFLARERITLAYMAPTVVRFLVDALRNRTFPCLRLIALGGEVVDAEVMELTRQLFGPVHIANGFGTTETGVIALWVQPADQFAAGMVPAGYHVPDTELFILDDAGTPLSSGQAGEIAVASPYLFAGYRGHPELTAQVLEADPAQRPGWRLYRTGDLGKLDDAGSLTVLGRLDTKVKVRGRLRGFGGRRERFLHTLDAVADRGRRRTHD